MSAFAAQRALRRAGVTVELYNFEQTETSGSRGAPRTQTDDSPQEILAIPDPGGKSIAYGQWGVEVGADMTYLVHEDVKLDDGGGDGASRIVQDGNVFAVIDADRTQQHGFQVLECERETESELA